MPLFSCADVGVDQRLRLFPQWLPRAVRQPQAHQPAQEYRRTERGDVGRESRGELSALARLAIGAAKGADQPLVLADRAGELRGEIVHVLALELHHRQRAALAHIVLERAEDLEKEALHALEGGNLSRVQQRVRRVEKGQGNLLADLVQDLALAREVVVDGPLGDTGGRGDLVEGGTGDPVAVKARERGVDDCGPGAGRGLLGPAHGRWLHTFWKVSIIADRPPGRLPTTTSMTI